MTQPRVSPVVVDGTDEEEKKMYKKKKNAQADTTLRRVKNGKLFCCCPQTAVCDLIIHDVRERLFFYPEAAFAMTFF